MNLGGKLFVMLIGVLKLSSCGPITPVDSILVEEGYWEKYNRIPDKEKWSWEQKLDSIPADIEDDVPLLLLPLVTHLNSRLKNEKLPLTFKLELVTKPSSLVAEMYLNPKLDQIHLKILPEDEMRKVLEKMSVYEVYGALVSKYSLGDVWVKNGDIILINWVR